jgi:hypothetical protein
VRAGDVEGIKALQSASAPAVWERALCSLESTDDAKVGVGVFFLLCALVTITRCVFVCVRECVCWCMCTVHRHAHTHMLLIMHTHTFTRALSLSLVI